MENKENREKIFLLSLSFGLGISKLLLALTTAIFVFPTVSGKVIELGYSDTWATISGVIASVVIALSIDGLAGLFYPDGLTGLIAKRKGRWLYLFITVVGLALYAASGTFSIWMAPMVSDVIVTAPVDSSMTLYNKETETYNKGFEALTQRVELAQIELEAAQTYKDFSYLAKHSDPKTRRQLLAYIKNPNTENWATKTLKSRVRKIDKAKSNYQKDIDKAQKKLDAALLDQSNYIERAGARRDAKQSQLKATETRINEQHKADKAEAENVVIWIDIVMLFIIVLGNPIRIYYAKINGETLPASRSIAYAFYRVGVAFTNRLVWAIEFLTRIDVNGDGVTGKPKDNTALKPNLAPVELAPISYEKQLSEHSLNRRLESQLDNTKRHLELKIQNDLDRLKRENLEFKKQSKLKTKKSKSTPQPLSLKGKPLDKSKLPPIEKTEGWHGLDFASQKELIRFRQNILDKKKSLENVSKAARNAYKAATEKTGETKKRNAVKLNWVATVLRNHNQKVSFKNGLEITSE